MLSTVNLPLGDHTLSHPVAAWNATFVPLAHPPAVKLTASIEGGPNPPPFPGQGTAATTLAIQMDARVAIALYETLGNLGRSMGWLPQEGAGRQV
jgi:hypothetical protein